jgi:hypothetical protein
MPQTIKLQQRIDELEREFHDKHDPKVRKELDRLTEELARLKGHRGLDAKEKALVKEIRSKIIRRNYDEIDILALLILLRRYSSMRAATYEFANFVAHRERNRGSIYDYLIDGKNQVLRALKKPPGRPEFRSVYTATDLKESLNEALSIIGVAHVDSFETNDILLCIICLLQDVRIIDKNDVIVLQISWTANHIDLHGVVLIGDKFVSFPVLAVPNHHGNRLKGFEHTVAKSVVVRGRKHEEVRVLKNVISARCHNGDLTVFQGDPLARRT